MNEVVSTYHVFINHRGPDAKRTLASVIYHTLKRSDGDLRVFLDQKELQPGNTLSPAIRSAIRSASVYIAIFSEKYAESPWCMNELLEMWQSYCSSKHRKTIIPVFYGVQPLHLRHIAKGPYDQSFHRHQNNGEFDAQVVERWRHALKEISLISGLVFDMEQGDLGEIAYKIVDRVLKEVRWGPLSVTEYPVGLDQAAEHFENEILKQREMSSSMTVGIVGLDGSGKSTLVKHLYNLKRLEFRRSCFLSEISNTDLPFLQQKLLHDLLGYENFIICNTDQGKSLIRDRLKGYPQILIVIDGLENIEQVRNLLLVKDVLGEGSLILVTSRDECLLATSQVNLLYDIKLLNAKDGQELFCRHAFHEHKPPKDFEQFVEEFVKICGGFPLALKALGSQLYGKHDRDHWFSLLEKLHGRELPFNRVKKILQVIYNSLSRKEKEVLLDIAHFLEGEDINLVVTVMEGLDSNNIDCLETLRQRCLLDSDFDDELRHHKRPFKGGPSSDICMNQWKIRMHDVVRDLARQISRDEFLYSPLSKSLCICCSDDITNAPQWQSRPWNIRGIRIDKDSKDPEFPRKNMSGLKFLVIEDCMDSFPFDCLSGDLVWLRLGKFHCDRIPDDLSLRNVRVLELNGVGLESLNSIFDCQEPSLQLRELTVDCSQTSEFIPSTSSKISPSRTNSSNRISRNSSGSNSNNRNSVFASKSNSSSLGGIDDNDTESPSLIDSIQNWLPKLKNLVKIVLKNVKGLTSLPIDFEELRNLSHLDLSGCSDLKVLPDSFSGLLQLEYLALKDCSNLIVPDLGQLCTLKHLDFEGCSVLDQLPARTIAQGSLRYLNLTRTSLQHLPEHLGLLENLQELLIGSPRLRTLPCSQTNLDRLTNLTLSGCPGLYDASRFIEQFEHLETLQICGVGLRTLPAGILWRKIKVLDVMSCPLGQLSFERPKMRMDRGGTPLMGENFDQEGVGDLSMNTAYASYISSLRDLRVRCTRISMACIPEAVSLCPNLELVDLSNNPYLSEIQGLPGNLIRLDLTCCPALKSLPRLSHLARLKFLNVSRCGGLETLNVQGLRSIEKFEADRCWELQSIQGLKHVKKLSYLHISTGNNVSTPIWRDILEFPSSVSTAIFSGVAVGMNFDDTDRFLRPFIQSKFKDATVMDIHTFEENPVSLQGALLVCFIADVNYDLRVIFEGDPYHSNQIYRTQATTWSRKTYRLYIFMWTEDSELFKDARLSCKGAVNCSMKPSRPLQDGPGVNALKRGWAVVSKHKTDGVKLCRHFLSLLL